MRILIYGFGRMGLTHYAILNSLRNGIEFSIVEPNNLLRKILSKNLNAEFYSEDSALKDEYDITLITTPPSLHTNILSRCIERGDKKIFVEKPFGGHTNIELIDLPDKQKVNIGYVLRFNPCIQWVKSNINPDEIDSIYGEYISNTLEKKPAGWRNGPYSGVLNEMGSHIIDVTQYILGRRELTVINSKKQSVVSDIDDIVEAKLITEDNILVSFYFNWVEKNARKPMFKLEIMLKSGIRYVIDQQQINIYNSGGDHSQKISVVDLVKSVPYYLRGVDFTDQMKDFLGERKIMASIDESLLVNRLIAEILKS